MPGINGPAVWQNTEEECVIIYFCTPLQISYPHHAQNLACAHVVHMHNAQRTLLIFIRSSTRLMAPELIKVEWYPENSLRTPGLLRVHFKYAMFHGPRPTLFVY